MAGHLHVSPILLDKAARILSAGGLIAYPTEAVYGLGCLPARQDTVERLLALKYRSWRKGLALVAAVLPLAFGTYVPSVDIPGHSAIASVMGWPFVKIWK